MNNIIYKDLRIGEKVILGSCIEHGLAIVKRIMKTKIVVDFKGREYGFRLKDKKCMNGNRYYLRKGVLNKYQFSQKLQRVYILVNNVYEFEATYKDVGISYEDSELSKFRIITQ